MPSLPFSSENVSQNTLQWTLVSRKQNCYSRDVCWFLHIGKQQFSFCSRAFSPTPCICQHKSPSSTLFLHTTQQVPLHVSLPILNQKSPRMLVPHYRRKNVTVRNRNENRKHTFYYFLLFSLSFLSQV